MKSGFWRTDWFLGLAVAASFALAYLMSSGLQADLFVRPTWADRAELAIILLAGAYVVALLPRLQTATAAVVSGSVFAALIVVHATLMIGANVWLQLMMPATLVAFGYAALASKRLLLSRQPDARPDAGSGESNRMLALAYQGQGQLDAAWNKFRQVPLSEALLEDLYSLALEFDKKRHFGKAEAVLRYLENSSPAYRDVQERLALVKERAEAATVSASAAPAKPRFGAFEVEGELGKGVIGVVYRGKDAKVGREVAIKTLPLAQEFDAEHVGELKERFFREAQRAGALSHRNIATIYDTGEERDVCYIAMELLKGGDLVPFTRPGHLLQPEKAVSIIARVADALAYAHREGALHYDVKPGNIFYDPETDTVKITDFGIARLTATTRTKAGLTLGAPAYMSPELLSGSRVDARSDLFSLGATLYQLLCGKPPFSGESTPQLMFRIANEPPADIRTVNSGVPEALAAFVERALAKNPDERFQSAEEFGGALGAALAGGAVRPAAASVDIEL